MLDLFISSNRPHSCQGVTGEVVYVRATLTYFVDKLKLAKRTGLLTKEKEVKIK